LCPGIGWHCRPGRGQGLGSGSLPIGSMRLVLAPEPRAEASASQPRASSLVLGCARAYPMGIALEPRGDPREISWGVSSVGNDRSQGLIYPEVGEGLSSCVTPHA
jgi:hypothetical protein